MRASLGKCVLHAIEVQGKSIQRKNPQNAFKKLKYGHLHFFKKRKAL